MDKPLPDDFNPYMAEMNMPNWYELALALLLAVFGWLFKREVRRIDDIEDREVDYVTRTDFDKTIQKWHDDRKEKHQENVMTLGRIEKKIDENEERSAHTRHDIRDRVGALSTEVAVLNRLMNDKRPR